MRVAVCVDLAMGDQGWLLQRAVAFAERAEARLDLVYVAEASHQAELDAALHTVPAHLRGQAHLLGGSPGDELVRISSGYDAIVVGPREPAGLEALLQGPMAVRVLRSSTCPVYVPRTDRFGQRRPRLLVGVELGNDRLDYILRTVEHWARVLDGSVDVVTAIPRSLPPVRVPDLREAARREWEATHGDTIDALTELLQRLDPPLRGTPRIAPGEPEDALVDLSPDYDLIVVGNRERKGMQRFLLGGVARVIVRRSAADVLVLPTASASG